MNTKVKAKRITPRNRRFAEEYAKSGNATQSAIAAGYKPSRAGVTGSELIKRGVSDQLMKEYNVNAFSALNKVATEGKSEMARVVAADKLLTRTHDMPYNSENDMKVPSITINVNKLSDLVE